MAQAPKRLWIMRDPEFRDYCAFFAAEYAYEILTAAAPDPTDLALAKQVFASRIQQDHLAFLTVTDETLGAAIDGGVTVGITLTVTTAVAAMIRAAVRSIFPKMAKAYVAAGLAV